MDYILLIAGFVLLIKGADYFVDGSSSVARILKVPTIVIGLTVVAFGTSMPEFSVSITAAMRGDNDLAVSNVLGSNIFNLLVVLGCCALVNPVQAKWSLLKKEFPFSIFITVILLLLNSNFSITKVLSGGGTFVLGRGGGILFLVLFMIFLYATVTEALAARGRQEDDSDEYEVLSPVSSALYIGCGLAGITIVALGTSLPELVTSVVAAGKGENDLAVGNVVGSNIFNILLILGASSAITPIVMDVTAVYDTAILIAASLLVYLAALSKREIRRSEGIVFLLAYLVFFAYILMR